MGIPVEQCFQIRRNRLPKKSAYLLLQLESMGNAGKLQLDDLFANDMSVLHFHVFVSLPAG